MKGTPDSLAKAGSRDNYILHLCEQQTDFSKVAGWITNLGYSSQSQATKISEQEIEALSDLAVTTRFIQRLAKSIPLPSFSKRNGQVYVSRLKALEAEIKALTFEVDLFNFAVPIDNLRELKMADGALRAIDSVVTKRTGAGMGSLYNELSELCLLELSKV